MRLIVTATNPLDPSVQATRLSHPEITRDAG